MKTCKTCGQSKPLSEFYSDLTVKDGRRGSCKVCHRARVKAYAEANPEKVAAKNKRLYEENREQRLEYQIAHHHANRERELKRMRNAYEDNREERINEARNVQGKRRALEQGSPAENIDIDFLLYRDAGICGICEEPVDPEDWHLDHIIPLSKGGHHTYANVQVAHPELQSAEACAASASTPGGLMSTHVVKAIKPFASGVAGRVIRKGETFRSDHEIVAAHRELFEGFEPDNATETATANPGEKRTTKPATTKRAAK